MDLPAPSPPSRHSPLHTTQASSHLLRVVTADEATDEDDEPAEPGPGPSAPREHSDHIPPRGTAGLEPNASAPLPTLREIPPRLSNTVPTKSSLPSRGIGLTGGEGEVAAEEHVAGPTSLSLSLHADGAARRVSPRGPPPLLATPRGAEVSPRNGVRPPVRLQNCPLPVDYEEEPAAAETSAGSSASARDARASYTRPPCSVSRGRDGPPYEYESAAELALAPLGSFREHMGIEPPVYRAPAPVSRPAPANLLYSRAAPVPRATTELQSAPRYSPTTRPAPPQRLSLQSYSEIARGPPASARQSEYAGGAGDASIADGYGYERPRGSTSAEYFFDAPPREPVRTPPPSPPKSYANRSTRPAPPPSQLCVSERSTRPSPPPSQLCVSERSTRPPPPPSQLCVSERRTRPTPPPSQKSVSERSTRPPPPPSPEYV